MKYPITVYIHSDNEPHADGTHARIPLIAKNAPNDSPVVGYLGVHPDDLSVKDALERSRLTAMDVEVWAARRGYRRKPVSAD